MPVFYFPNMKKNKKHKQDAVAETTSQVELRKYSENKLKLT